MDKRQESTIKKLGIFTLEQGKEIGLSQQDISRLVTAKDLKRVGRGLYLPPNAELDSDVGFKSPLRNSVLMPLSAAFPLSLQTHPDKNGPQRRDNQ